LATGLFFLSLAFWNRSVVLDVVESNVPIVAIEQGAPQCAYPAHHWTAVPPLYSSIAAGLISATGIGKSDISPSQTPILNCHRLAHQNSRFPALPLVLIGTTGWFVIIAGFISLMAATGRARTRWEILGLGLMAVTPAIASALVRYLHPEDLFAMGFILAASAAAIRSRWLAAGVCIGIAFSFKQYALLPAVPLMIAAPRGKRLRFGLGAIGSVVAIFIPFEMTMGRGVFEVMRGTDATPSFDGTALLGQLGIHGTLLVLISRGLPLLGAAAAAVWARSRLGSEVSRPQPLIALIAISLVLRLVFEVNIFSYYFLATSVILIALDIVMGRIRLETICWIMALAAFFPPWFDPLLLVYRTHPSVIQVILVIPAVALTALPLYRVCTPAADIDSNAGLGLTERVPSKRLKTGYRRHAGIEPTLSARSLDQRTTFQGEELYPTMRAEF
jgi:hypothetical protein